MITRSLFTSAFLAIAMVLLHESGYSGDPAAENRDAVLRILKNIAARAQQHYHLPASMGGGHGAFDGSTDGFVIATMDDLTKHPEVSTGTFEVGSVSSGSISIYGTGRITGVDNSMPVEVEIVVFPDSIAVTLIN